MRIISFSIIIPTLFTLTISTQTFASELHMSKAEALQKGFVPVKPHIIENREVEWPAHSLGWPVIFKDTKHTIGNSMTEYQNYGGTPYFHEGSDLRVSYEGEVKTPVSGFLVGNYYTYVTNPDTGEDQKYTTPYDSGGDPLYFEIHITDEQGFQFEFHHVNPNKLPANILKLVKSGGGQISRGETIGYAADWPMSRLGDRYDHIHYNILTPNRVYLNAEYYSVDLPDNTAPVIKNIYAISGDKKIEVMNTKLDFVPQELIISSYDLKGENIYQLPPTFIEVKWAEIESSFWDFTKKFISPTGAFPDIRKVYARNVRLNDGRLISSQGDYRNTAFLFRLSLPSHAKLPLILTVRDVSQNENTVRLSP